MNLKEALSEVGMKQIDLARISGVNVRQINRLVAGESKLENTTAKNLLSIASALNMTAEELMSENSDPPAKVSFTSETDDLSPEEKRSILKVEHAKDYSGWRRYPTTCGKLLDRIPDDWWNKYSARHIGEVMRLLEKAYSEGLDSGRSSE